MKRIHIEVIETIELSYYPNCFLFKVEVGQEIKTFKCDYVKPLSRFYISDVTISDEEEIMKLEKEIEDEINEHMKFYRLLV